MPGPELDDRLTAPPKIKGAATGVAGGYTKISIVGRGAFGDIYLVRDTRKGGEQLILKQVNTKGLSQAEVRATKQETAVLKHVRHPYIVGYHDTFEEDGVVSIVMEFAAGGDLGRLIQKRMKETSGGQRFTESEIKRFARQLGTALEYLHGEVHLLHRDIKPKNVFLSSQGEVRLGDFGLSIALSKSDGQATSKVGTPLYMSPELAAGKPYDRSADVWAFGCTLYESMGFKPPWNELCTADGQIEGGMKRLEAALKHNSLKTEALRKFYSAELCEMIDGLLAKQHESRLPLSKLLAKLSETPKVPSSWGLSAEAMAALEAMNESSADADKPDTEQPTDPPSRPLSKGGLIPTNARRKTSNAGRRPVKPAPVPTVPLWDLPDWNPAQGIADELVDDDLEEEVVEDGVGAMGVEVHAAASVLQRSFKERKKKVVNIRAPGEAGAEAPSTAPAGGAGGAGAAGAGSGAGGAAEGTGKRPNVRIAWQARTGGSGPASWGRNASGGGGPPSWGRGAGSNNASPMPSWGKCASAAGGSGPASWGKNASAAGGAAGYPVSIMKTGAGGGGGGGAGADTATGSPKKPALKPSRVLRASPADLEEKRKARAAARPPSPRPPSPRTRRREEEKSKPKKPGLKPTRVRDGFG